jgi:hypothetical protein
MPYCVLKEFISLSSRLDAAPIWFCKPSTSIVTDFFFESHEKATLKWRVWSFTERAGSPVHRLVLTSASVKPNCLTTLWPINASVSLAVAAIVIRSSRCHQQRENQRDLLGHSSTPRELYHEAALSVVYGYQRTAAGITLPYILSALRGIRG